MRLRAPRDSIPDPWPALLIYPIPVRFRRSGVRPFRKIQEAVYFIDAFAGDDSSLRLPIDDVLQDPIGANMAIVLDRALARGWLPNGYEQHDGFRVYKFKSA
jgi:hypothetical protein